ncbi:ciliary microtubule inner protein 4-like isoform X3 [Mobula birostris]
MKTKVTTANEFPGRTLFGTTLDSKGLSKEIPEEEQLPDTSNSCHRLMLPLAQGTDIAHKTQQLSGPKSGHCVDSESILRPKSESVHNAIGSRLSLPQDMDCQARLKTSRKTQAASPDRRSSERQVDGEEVSVQGGTPGTQSPLCETPESLPTPEEKCLIPKNIQHKFGTHVVNEVLSDEKVKEFLNQKEFPARDLDSKDTTAGVQESVTDEADMYEKIGYPLRCNIFPGLSSRWKSEAQSTYTQEVVDRFRRDPEHWHSRTTDDLGARTDTLLAQQRLSKSLQQYLEEQPKLTRDWPEFISRTRQRATTARPGQPEALKRVAAKLPTTVPRTKRPVAKPKVAVAPGGRAGSEITTNCIDKKDEMFWEFYNQPLPPL